MKQMMHKKEYTKEQIARAMAICEVERTIKNVNNYRIALLESPQKEMAQPVCNQCGSYPVGSRLGERHPPGKQHHRNV